MRRLKWFLGVVVCSQVACGGGGETSGSACDKVFYRDADTDGYGNPADSLTRCDPPAGYVDNDLDCDDTDERVNPDTAWHPDADGDGAGDANKQVTQCVAPKGHILDGSDCNDDDPALGPMTAWYADADGDGYGDAGAKITQCQKPDGHVGNADDCDDKDAKVNPDTVWYQDMDGDGWGGAASGMKQCAQPPGDVLVGGDCDDSDPALSPDTLWYADADGDGSGDPATGQKACVQPAGHVLDGHDCDDGDKLVYPGLGTCPFDVGGKSCKDVLASGQSKGDGAYLVDLDGPAGNPPVPVWCDMTTDGGGWTALFNPSNESMPAAMLPGVTYSGTVLSGTDTCPENPYQINLFGWYGIHWQRCGDMTIRTTVSWANGIGATDLMFTATLAGQNIATITADGVEMKSDAVTVDAGGGNCVFYNGTDSSVVTPTATCHSENAAIDAAPAVHNGAFVGDVNIEITTGAACQPTCQYSTGHTIQKLFAR